MGQRIGRIPSFDFFAAPTVFFGVGLRVSYHAIYVLLRQLGGPGDRDFLLFTGILVSGGDREYPVGIYIKCDLDLRRTARRRPYAFQPEVAQRAVVARQLALSLKDVDVNSRLVVVGGREYFGLVHRYGRIALDQLCHYPAQRLHPERERRDVEQQHVLDLSGENARLNRRADGNYFIGIDRLIRLFAAGKAADESLNRRDPG